MTSPTCPACGLRQTLRAPRCARCGAPLDGSPIAPMEPLPGATAPEAATAVIETAGPADDRTATREMLAPPDESPWDPVPGPTPASASPWGPSAPAEPGFWRRLGRRRRSRRPPG